MRPALHYKYPPHRRPRNSVRSMRNTLIKYIFIPSYSAMTLLLYFELKMLRHYQVEQVKCLEHLTEHIEQIVNVLAPRVDIDIFRRDLSVGPYGDEFHKEKRLK